LIRVAFTVLQSKYQEEHKVYRKKIKRESEDFNPRGKAGASLNPKTMPMKDVCSLLDLIQISKVFMTLLSHVYISSKAVNLPRLKVAKSFNLEYLMNLCAMNNEYFQRVQIVKEVIANVVDCLDLNEVTDKKSLQLLRQQLEKSNKKVLHGVPKLNKFLELIDKRQRELDGLHVEGIDNKDEATNVENLIVPVDKLHEFYEQEIEDRHVATINEEQDDYRLFEGKNKTIIMSKSPISSVKSESGYRSTARQRSRTGGSNSISRSALPSRDKTQQ
jgi:hypothetical protein